MGITNDLLNGGFFFGMIQAAVSQHGQNFADFVIRTISSAYSNVN